MIPMFALAVRPAVSAAFTWSVRSTPPAVVTLVMKLPLHAAVTVHVSEGLVALPL